MKKFLLLLLFPLISFGQEDIERFKVYETTNNYNSLLLDSATGQIWHLQIGLFGTKSVEKTTKSEKCPISAIKVPLKCQEYYKFANSISIHRFNL